MKNFKENSRYVTPVEVTDRECPHKSKLVDELVACAEAEDAQYERTGVHPSEVYWRKKQKTRLRKKKKK